MLLNASFIAACLFLANVCQAAPVGEIGNQNGIQISSLQFERRQISAIPRDSLRRRDAAIPEEAKLALDSVKKTGAAKIQAVTDAGGTVEDSEILAVIKKADAENPNKDVKTAQAIKAGFLSLIDEKLAAAKGKSPSRRQRRDAAIPEEAKLALDSVKKTGAAKIQAVTDAGGTVEDSEILAVIKKADAENPNKDVKTAQAIKAGFLSLIDEKLAAAKGKSSS
ncbi:hypothetical protein DFH28DRAFT_204644 [Melampsora americana]|nr:hypothetical protein DFH28DRAFT_204644 [Melampsora americana]